MRPLPTKIALKATYSGRRCRLNVDIPSHQACFPLNTGGAMTYDESRVDLQKWFAPGRDLNVGLYQRPLDPLRPADVAIAIQAIAEHKLDTVLFVPAEPVSPDHYGGLKALLQKVFFPLFKKPL